MSINREFAVTWPMSFKGQQKLSKLQPTKSLFSGSLGIGRTSPFTTSQTFQCFSALYAVILRAKPGLALFTLGKGAYVLAKGEVIPFGEAEECLCRACGAKPPASFSKC